MWNGGNGSSSCRELAFRCFVVLVTRDPSETRDHFVIHVNPYFQRSLSRYRIGTIWYTLVYCMSLDPEKTDYILSEDWLSHGKECSI